jgi:hypothetical protein
MRRREIWWVRWARGYRPVHWKAWASLAAFCCAIPANLWLTTSVTAALCHPGERLPAALSTVAIFLGFAWFVDRHAPPG